METLLAIAQRAYSKRLFRRWLAGIIVVAGLTVVISMMVSALLAGGLYAAYFALLHSRTEPQSAMIIIGVSAILTIVMLVILALSYLHHLRQLSRTLLKRSPLTSRAMDTLNTFSDGLMAD